jgi:RNA polymerase sigma factor (sigma-70 family)
MAANALNRMILHLRRASRPHEGNGLSDGDLLERYVSLRDPGAFEILLRRHGPMVWGVCRRILRSEADSEDAFQTTFLVFIRKAGSIRSGAGVGNWLYGVAHNTALKARALRRKRESKELEAGSIPRPQAVEEVWQQVQVLLDAELSRLPDKYRIPIVLCGLEGKTIREAARQLGWPQGTVATRLTRGRALLAGRLAKHGLELTGGVLASLLLHNGASASLPAAIVRSTVKVARVVLAGNAPFAGAISPGVANLARGVLKSMYLTHLKRTAALVLAVAALIGAVGTGVGMLMPAALSAHQPAAETRESDKPARAADAGRPKEPEPIVVSFGASAFRVAWSPDGKTLAAASLDYSPEEKEVAGKKTKVYVPRSTVTLYNSAGDEPQLGVSLGEEKGVHVESVAFSPDGKTAALAVRYSSGPRTDPSEVRLLDTSTGSVKKTISYGGYIRRLGFSPDGKSLAIGGQYAPGDALRGPFVRTIQLWAPEKDKPSSDFKQELGVDEVNKSGTLDGLRDLAFSPDGKLLATADADWKVRLLDARTGELRHTLEGSTDVVLGVAFAPDGKTLVTAGGDGTARVWDVQTGKEIRTLSGNKGKVWCVAFAPDGKYLATGGGVTEGGKTTSEAILWNAATGESVRVLPGGKGVVSTIAFSPDGKLLAVGGAVDDKGSGLKLWRVKEIIADKK